MRSKITLFLLLQFVFALNYFALKEIFMFTDFRDDDTQSLFTKALDGFGKFSFYGFKNVVL